MTRLLNALIDHRKICFWCALGATVVWVFLALRLEMDRRFDALIDLEAPQYRRYATYLERFGSDRVIIAALTSDNGADHPPVLAGLARTAERLAQIPDVVAVTTLLDMATVQNAGGGITPRPLAAEGPTGPVLDYELLQRMRSTWPAIHQLISLDGRTLGVLIRLQPIDRQQVATTVLLEQFRTIVGEAFAPLAVELHMSGVPVFLEAVSRYNAAHAWRFMLLSMVVGLLVQLYIFKGVLVPLVILTISGTAVLWVVGLMGLLGITLNPVSSMAFGMLLILTAMAVIHLVTHYYDRLRDTADGETALRAAVHTVARPSLMCAVTTAAGFAAITLCTISAVRQFGLIMALGAILAFVLVYLLLPFLLLRLPALTPRAIARRESDLLARIHEGLGRLVLARPGLFVAGGLLLLVLLFMGMPRITVDTRFLSLFHDEAPEMVSHRLIKERLADPDAIHVMVETDPDRPLNAQALLAIQGLEQALLQLPGVTAGHSFFRVLETFHQGLFGIDGGSLYDSPYLFQEMYRRALSHPDSRRLFEGSVDFDSRCFCISLWTEEENGTDFDQLLQRIDALADQQLQGVGQVWVTGSLALAHAQSQRLIAAQSRSLALALVLIALLLIVQFRSWRLGLLSLIPNLFPLAALFGAMGWLSIPLDNMTIMVAVVSFGLSVDDTVHYLTHLKTGLGQGTQAAPIRAALAHAYRVSAKALIATSAIIVLSLLTLGLSPFKPAAAFGLLAALAAAAALASDILFMPALILWSRRLQNTLLAGFRTSSVLKRNESGSGRSLF
ncbi:efflux RND transporter permease subunit [Desulfatitalea alkaliphila]|uniref:MMPL family transporter n=1 Tax=Desulfatitalea alkaliphila TaxID=2929485 RepID=A0AA41R126_9BACT|nr:MMPL family transporter [Desulfatitalea alkaliphila]MCJ8500227.1 MMPL family transporter [Desulfatitalea alkaliphila]